MHQMGIDSNCCYDHAIVALQWRNSDRSIGSHRNDRTRSVEVVRQTLRGGVCNPVLAIHYKSVLVSPRGQRDLSAPDAGLDRYQRCRTFGPCVEVSNEAYRPRTGIREDESHHVNGIVGWRRRHCLTGGLRLNAVRTAWRLRHHAGAPSNGKRPEAYNRCEASSESAPRGGWKSDRTSPAPGRNRRHTRPESEHCSRAGRGLRRLRALRVLNGSSDTLVETEPRAFRRTQNRPQLPRKFRVLPARLVAVVLHVRMDPHRTTPSSNSRSRSQPRLARILSAETPTPVISAISS